MKRLIFIILLLFPLSVWGGDVSTVSGVADSSISTVSGVAGASISTVCGVNYNDGDAGTTAYCASQSPKCDDFEGETLCYTGYDSACRFTYNAKACTGGTIDFTAATPASYPCSGTTNTGTVLFTKNSTDSTNCYVYEDFTAGDEFWIKAYVNIATLPASSGAVSPILSFYGSGVTLLALWLDTTAGGQGRMYIRYISDDTPTYVYGGTTNVSVNTWYKITLHWKKSTGSDGVAYFKIDSTVVTNVTNHACTKQPSRYYMGVTTGNDAVATIYFDNVNVLSGADEPEDCS